MGLSARPTSLPTPLRARRSEKNFSGWLTILFALLLSSAFIDTALAQDTDRIDPQLTNTPLPTYVIRNARIVTVSGADIENGTVVISNGRIAAVGANATVPAGAQEIDGRGLIVYPGMIDLATNMGLAEVSSGAPGTIDTQELGDMNPNISAVWAVNPHSVHIAVTRVAGVTNALSGPSGGIISGQATFVNLFGSSPREMALVPEAALVIQFPRIGGGGFGGLSVTPEALTQRDRRIEELRKIFRDAEAYGRAQDAYRKDPKSVPRPAIDPKLAALVPYARGERPIIFRAERDREMRAVIRFAEELKLKADHPRRERRLEDRVVLKTEGRAGDSRRRVESAAGAKTTDTIRFTRTRRSCKRPVCGSAFRQVTQARTRVTCHSTRAWRPRTVCRRLRR